MGAGRLGLWLRRLKLSLLENAELLWAFRSIADYKEAWPHAISTEEWSDLAGRFERLALDALEDDSDALDVDELRTIGRRFGLRLTDEIEEFERKRGSVDADLWAEAEDDQAPIRSDKSGERDEIIAMFSELVPPTVTELRMVPAPPPQTSKRVRFASRSH